MSDTSRELRHLHPALVVRWGHMQREWAERYPNLPTPFLTCTHRGEKDQTKALREGKSRARFGQSLHNYVPAYAFDIAFQKDGVADWSFHLFERMAEIAEPLGLEWGGRWPGLVDGPHFQLPMTWQDAQAGRVPTLPELSRVDASDAPTPWKLVVIDRDGAETVLSLGETPNVLTRYDADKRRMYVAVQRAGEG